MLLTLIIKLWIFLILTCALKVISDRNPVNSLLYLILIFIISAIYLMFNNIDFIALLLIIVYVGGIAVLFLFLLMMTNLRYLKNDNNIYNHYNKYLMYILLIIGGWSATSSIKKIFLWGTDLDLINDQFFGIDYFILIYTQYWYPFILIGFILLISMVCTIVLSLDTSVKKFK